LLEELAASLHCLLLVKTKITILDMQLAHWFQVRNVSQFDPMVLVMDFGWGQCTILVCIDYFKYFVFSLLLSWQ